MSNNKQTAVEFYRHGLYALTKIGNITVEEEEELFEQANQMFKEQIMDAWNKNPQVHNHSAKHYYNQEYGGNNDNNKQTAVKWLAKEYEKWSHGDFFIPNHLLEHAKEMEKQQQDLLNECEIQLEYLNQKFGETGTTNALIAKLKNK